MKIALTYSTKTGLRKEFGKRFVGDVEDEDIPPDLFAEGDDLRTINAIIEALQSNQHEVVGLESDDDVYYRLEKLRPDLVFNIAEGLFGDWRESYVPMICERLGLAYTGSSPLTLGICLNKARCKEILSYYQIPNPPFQIIYPERIDFALNFDLPAIVKPIAEGSSKGIFNDSVVTTLAEAQAVVERTINKYKEPVIIEKFLTGREFTVAVFGNGNNLEILPIISMDYSQLPPGAHAFYSYEAKWVWDRPEKPLQIFECPAQISPALEQAIKAVVSRTFQVMQIRDWARIDLRLDEQEIPNILEINPLPGILPDPKDNSCFPKAARTAGYSYSAMLQRVVELAAMRCGVLK